MNSESFLCVNVSKPFLTYSKNYRDSLDVGIGFEMKSGFHDPLWWFKWIIVVNLMKNLDYEGKHPMFSFVTQHYVHKNPGGVSERAVNRGNYRTHQMFILLHSGTADTDILDIEVHDFVNHTANKNVVKTL